MVVPGTVLSASILSSFVHAASSWRGLFPSAPPIGQRINHALRQKDDEYHQHDAVDQPRIARPTNNKKGTAISRRRLNAGALFVNLVAGS